MALLVGKLPGENEVVMRASVGADPDIGDLQKLQREDAQ